MPADPQVVLVTGASSGFGRLTAHTLARTGHVVVAGMRATTGRNAPAVQELDALAAEGLSVFAVELDVQSQPSRRRRRRPDPRPASASGRRGAQRRAHGSGPAEAFTPEELAAVYDVNVLGTQRVNRAVLPQLRRQGSGLLVWVGSSSTRGGTRRSWRRTSRPRPVWTHWPRATPAS